MTGGAGPKREDGQKRRKGRGKYQSGYIYNINEKLLIYFFEKGTVCSSNSINAAI